jgi:hypothetical protein
MPRSPYDELETAHKYVGRFMWAFANVERDLDQILVTLFSLNNTASLILMNNLDFRKKMNLAKIGLQHQEGHSTSRHTAEPTFKMLHKLGDLRNIVAHSAYLPEPEGITFTYSRANEKLTFPKTTFSYSELDEFWRNAREVSDALCEIQRSCSPIADEDAQLRDAIIAEVKGNVVPFPTDRG